MYVVDQNESFAKEGIFEWGKITNFVVGMAINTENNNVGSDDSLEVKGATYKDELSASYNLVVQVRSMSIGYAVLDPILNTYVAYGFMPLKGEDVHYARQEEYILKKEVFSREYRKVIVVVDSPKRTLVPKSYFDSQKMMDVLKFVGFGITTDEIVLSDEIELASAVVVYSLPKFLYFFLKSQFRQLEVRHALTTEVGAMLLKHTSGDMESKLRVNVGNRWMDVILVKNNKLHLVNRFKSPSANDFVYNIVNLISQTGLNEKEVKIEVGGAISSEEDQKMVLLRRFVSNIEMDAMPQYYTYDFSRPMEEYRYSTLFRIPTCE